MLTAKRAQDCDPSRGAKLDAALPGTRRAKTNLEMPRARPLLAPMAASLLPHSGEPSSVPHDYPPVAPSTLNLQRPDLTTRLIVRGIPIQKSMDYESECILTHL